MTNANPTPIANAIETRALGKLYRRHAAVNNLNLIAPTGQVFGLLGPNGAGKTTVIEMLLGITRPTSGSAFLLGKPVGDAQTRRRVGFLPEKPPFYDFLTAGEFLNLRGRLGGMDSEARRRRVPEMLERVGLGDKANVKIREFSGGMQQRLGLAQALLRDPDLIILDEPTSALDPLGRRDVRDIIAELRERGKTVLLSSRLPSEIETICDRAAIIKRGEIAIQGTLRELLQVPSTVDIEVANLNDASLFAVRQIAAKLRLGRVPITQFTATVRQESDSPELARAIIQNGSQLLALIPKRETLEELFLRIMEEEQGTGNREQGTEAMRSSL